LAAKLTAESRAYRAIMSLGKPTTVRIPAFGGMQSGELKAHRATVTRFADPLPGGSDLQVQGSVVAFPEEKALRSLRALRFICLSCRRGRDSYNFLSKNEKESRRYRPSQEEVTT